MESKKTTNRPHFCFTANTTFLLTNTIPVQFTARITTTSSVGNIPNGYTSDVVLNQQARVAHQGGMADCLPGGPVAREIMAVLDAGTYGGSGDRLMAGCLVVHA
jgi:hypothetical protein